MHGLCTKTVSSTTSQRIGTCPERKPEGRFLTEEDLTPSLVNRRAEVRTPALICINVLLRILFACEEPPCTVVLAGQQALV